MGTFFSELAKKLAERWVSLLLVPGVLFIAAVGISVRVGQRHALDPSHLTAAVTDASTLIARQSVGTQAMVVTGVLLVAAGTGLAVQALASVTQVLYLGPWPRILAPIRRWRVTRRRRR